MTKLGEHAVVLGASMSGLLAARVLADFYRSVTVVERDVLPTNTAQRRGVPQGRHVHALWARGSQILDELFPGFLNDLLADVLRRVGRRQLVQGPFVLWRAPVCPVGKIP
jgi:2-polyprenyl-6-methoxyphenol hydroxylase-like FAD-dependent oxidoreductase